MTTLPGLRSGLILFGHLLFAFGALLFLSPMAIRSSGRQYANVAFPLPDAQTVVRAGNGSLYIGEAMFGRIQHYDADGRFIRGWFVPVGGKYFRLSMAGDTLQALLNSHRVVLYDTLGNALGLRDTTGYPNPGIVVDRGPPGLYLSGTRVLEKDSANAIHPLTDLADPLWFLSPIFGWAIAACGVVLRLLVRWIVPVS